MHGQGRRPGHQLGGHFWALVPEWQGQKISEGPLTKGKGKETLDGTDVKGKGKDDFCEPHSKGKGPGKDIGKVGEKKGESLDMFKDKFKDDKGKGKLKAADASAVQAVEVCVRYDCRACAKLPSGNCRAPRGH